MKISGALWKAANKHLWNGENGGGSSASCYAIDDACCNDPVYREVIRFIKELGLDTHKFNFYKFCGPERQQARYNWLMFAYEVALEENL